MRFEHLSLTNYRNYHHLHCVFCERVNVFRGANAQGKTNLVEAVYYLGNLKSFRFNTSKKISQDLVMKGKPFGLIQAALVRQGFTYDIDIRLHRDRHRQIRVNQDCVASKITDYFQKMIVLSFSPDDLFLLKGAPEKRRAFFDRFIFHLRPQYLDLCRTYERLVGQKMWLLKQGKPNALLHEPKRREQLDLWNAQLAEKGAKIIWSRLELLRELEPLYQAFIQKISFKREHVNLFYEVAGLAGEKFVSEDQVREALTCATRRVLEEELRLGRTLVGPHLDDFLFQIQDGDRVEDMRFVASQGQIRTAVLALKLTQVELLKKCREVSPVLILDDVLSEFDSERISYIIEYLINYEGQTFLTCVDLDHVSAEFDPNIFKLHSIFDGKVSYDV